MANVVATTSPMGPVAPPSKKQRAPMMRGKTAAATTTTTNRSSMVAMRGIAQQKDTSGVGESNESLAMRRAELRRLAHARAGSGGTAASSLLSSRQNEHSNGGISTTARAEGLLAVARSNLKEPLVQPSRKVGNAPPTTATTSVAMGYPLPAPAQRRTSDIFQSSTSSKYVAPSVGSSSNSTQTSSAGVVSPKPVNALGKERKAPLIASSLAQPSINQQQHEENYYLNEMLNGAKGSAVKSNALAEDLLVTPNTHVRPHATPHSNQKDQTLSGNIARKLDDSFGAGSNQSDPAPIENIKNTATAPLAIAQPKSLSINKESSRKANFEKMREGALTPAKPPSVSAPAPAPAPTPTDNSNLGEASSRDDTATTDKSVLRLVQELASTKEKNADAVRSIAQLKEKVHQLELERLKNSTQNHTHETDIDSDFAELLAIAEDKGGDAAVIWAKQHLQRRKRQTHANTKPSDTKNSSLHTPMQGNQKRMFVDVAKRPIGANSPNPASTNDSTSPPNDATSNRDIVGVGIFGKAGASDRIVTVMSPFSNGLPSPDRAPLGTALGGSFFPSQQRRRLQTPMPRRRIREHDTLQNGLGNYSMNNMTSRIDEDDDGILPSSSLTTNGLDRHHLIAAAKSIPYEFASPLATYFVRRPYLSDPNDSPLHHWGPNVNNAETKQSSFSFSWQSNGISPKDQYFAEADVAKPHTIEVVTMIAADDSIFLLYGSSSAKHGVRSSTIDSTEMSKQGKTETLQWKVFEDIDTMEPSALGCVMYIDADGTERDYWLDAIFEGAVATRNCYCSSLVSAASALQETQKRPHKTENLAATGNGLAVSSGNNSVPITSVSLSTGPPKPPIQTSAPPSLLQTKETRPLLMTAPKKRVPKVDAWVQTDNVLTDPKLVSKGVTINDDVPVPMDDVNMDPAESSDAFSILLGFLLSTFFDLAWFISVTLPIKLFSWFSVLSFLGFLLVLLRFFSADDNGAASVAGYADYRYNRGDIF